MSTTGNETIDADHIIDRKAHIKAKIDSIHERKRMLVKKLQEFREKGFKNEDALMEKLLEAYDQLDSQEREYMQLFVDITRIHEQATEDYTNDMLETVDHLLDLKIDNKQQKSDEPESHLDDEIARLQHELVETQSRALKATMLNEKLVGQLTNEKTKHAYFNEYQKSSGIDAKGKAHLAKNDLEAMRIRVHGEQHENDRKQKQLERLRRKAVERGIMAAKEEDEQKKAFSPQVDEHNRVPRVEAEEKAKREEGEKKTQAQLEEERRKEIRERVKQQREQREQYSSIGDRFKAMEERRKRMDNIRDMLSKMQAIQLPSEVGVTDERDLVSTHNEDETEDGEATRILENTYANAKAKLRELTAMRENLENIRDATIQLDQGDELKTKKEEEEEDRSKDSRDSSKNGDKAGNEVETGMIDVVKGIFEDSIALSRHTSAWLNSEDTASLDTIHKDHSIHPRTSGNESELEKIRQILESQSQTLSEIQKQVGLHNH